MSVAWTGLYAWGAKLGYAYPNVRPLVEKVACDEPGISRFSARLLETTARISRSSVNLKS